MNTVARSIKPETTVRNYVNEAQKRMHSETGSYVPQDRRQYVFEDAGVRVVLYGAGLGHGPEAEYAGPLGTWCASFSIRGCGKPRRYEVMS